jgi:hypothetical protein
MVKPHCWVRAVAVVALLGNLPAAARADEVTDWNQMMLRAALIAGSSPLAITRVAAIVQTSVFDAVNGIDRVYTSIHVPPAAPAGASRRAAAVQAAYGALIKLFPTQQGTFDARRTVSLAEISQQESAAAIAAGVAWGESVANQIWTWRLTDGSQLPASPWLGNTAIGQWRPTLNLPGAGTSTPGAGYPQFFEMTPWVMLSPSQVRPGPPPALTSAQYARDFNEVRLMGNAVSPLRTTDQTIASWFWTAGTATYLWNTVALSLLEQRNRLGEDDGHGGDRGRRGRIGLLENARLFGALSVAMADAAIGCWDAKYTYNYWRPVTAIRDTGDDGNAATTADTSWMPLFPTPAHPEYPSGHSCLSGAAAAILADEFGEHTHFDVTSDVQIGVVRSFKSFSASLEEVKNARIFAGIHFRSATVEGTALGKAVAKAVLETAFQRVH